MDMLSARRAKIVATIGPATSSRENLEKAIRAGMNVARLNFSHGDHAGHLEVLKNIRELSRELQAPVTVLQDLQGPKIRVGKLEGDSIQLVEGESVVIDPAIEVGSGKNISTDFKDMPSCCEPGTVILMDDGLLELRVQEVKDNKVYCTVKYGGILKNRKGINIPGANLPVNALTEKDLVDLEFGLNNDVDYIAMSFVRQGDDIRELRDRIAAKGKNTRIVAKIEMIEAVENLQEIITLSDAVMVARGDLAVEVGQTQLPRIQKRIIQLANFIGKPVITATQMLDSMVENPRPTRAEVTDVANAVMDGSDALMLSAESASGDHPFKCIRTMHEIIREVEKEEDFYYDISLENDFYEVSESIAASACLSALKLHATAIVCLTTTGRTATMISGFRPKARIVAMTHIEEALNRLELTWGAQTFVIKPYNSTTAAMEEIEATLLKYGIVKPGDNVVLTMGLPVRSGTKTNSIRIMKVRDKSVQSLPQAELPLRCQSIED